jgi:hypothetical protein
MADFLLLMRLHGTATLGDARGGNHQVLNGKHLRVQVLGRLGLLVDSIEVSNIFTGFADDTRLIVSAVALVPRHDGTGVEGLDDVEGGEPVLSALSV